MDNFLFRMFYFLVNSLVFYCLYNKENIVLVILQGLLIIAFANIIPAFSYDIYFDKRPPPIQNLKADVGQPLILTPLIERNQTTEARQQAAVTFEDFTGPDQNITSYSGFLTVDKIFDSNLFFWFFLSQDKPATDPVVLWLQGGPGSSSIYAIFNENGPYSVNDALNISYAPYSWNKNHSVLYIDNPAGTGLSFTNGGYANNQTKVAEDLYEALLQFFKLFPELQKNPFFVTGESYGGHYIPAICYYIHQVNPSAELKINLQGLAIGNPLTDAKYQYGYSTYLYYLGLVDNNIIDIAETLGNLFIEAVENGSYTNASIYFNELRTTLHKASAIPNVYNHQKIVPDDLSYWVDYLIQNTIRPEIHIGNVSYGATDSVVSQHLFDDKTKSVKPWLEELINNYRVLLFNGQLDTLDPYPLMINLIRNMDFIGKEEYLEAQRQVWYVDGQIAGYWKTASNFTEVLVRNAGHMVPADQPLWAFDLVYKFIRNIPLS